MGQLKKEGEERLEVHGRAFRQHGAKERGDEKKRLEGIPD